MITQNPQVAEPISDQKFLGFGVPSLQWLRSLQREMANSVDVLILRHDTHLGLMCYTNAIAWALAENYGVLTEVTDHDMTVKPKRKVIQEKIQGLVALAQSGAASIQIPLTWLVDHAKRWWEGASHSRDTFRKHRALLDRLGIFKCDSNPDSYRDTEGQRRYYIPPLEQIDLYKLLALCEVLEQWYLQKHGFDRLKAATRGHCGYTVSLLFDAVFGKIARYCRQDEPGYRGTFCESDPIDCEFSEELEPELNQYSDCINHLSIESKTKHKICSYFTFFEEDSTIYPE